MAIKHFFLGISQRSMERINEEFVFSKMCVCTCSVSSTYINLAIRNCSLDHTICKSISIILYFRYTLPFQSSGIFVLSTVPQFTQLYTRVPVYGQWWNCVSEYCSSSNCVDECIPAVKSSWCRCQGLSLPMN